MSTEIMIDHHRKSSLDYTISIKDDDKNLIVDKQLNNFFVENLKNKRDRSPNTCQNNVDTANETADSSRINADKKNESNHMNTQSDSNSKRQKTVCYDFKKGVCRRRFCRVREYS